MKRLPQRTIKDLIGALARSSGNKVYLRDIEKIFEEKLGDLTPTECETLRYLIRDLEGLSQLQSQVNRMKSQPWKTW